MSAVRSHWNIIYWASWDKSAQVRCQIRLLRNSAHVIPKERSQMFIIPCVFFLWDIKLVMCRCAPRLYFPHRSNMSIEYSFAQTSCTKEKDPIIAFQPISHWLAPNLFIKKDCKLVAMGLIDKLIKKIRKSVLFLLLFRLNLYVSCAQLRDQLCSVSRVLNSNNYWILSRNVLNVLTFCIWRRKCRKMTK